jgi:hypothetical protein
MIVTCEADWEPSSVPEEKTLDIAGLRAEVYHKDDVWTWKVATAETDPWHEHAIGSGWAKTEALAIQAAEDAIMLACRPEIDIIS